MRIFTHAGIGGGIVGLALAVCGYTILTWQYWLLLAVVMLWYFTKPGATQ